MFWFMPRGHTIVGEWQIVMCVYVCVGRVPGSPEEEIHTCRDGTCTARA